MNGTEKQLKRIVRRIGIDAAEQLLYLHRADVSAQAACHRAERVAESNRLLQMLADLREADACMSLKQLVVSGGDLIALGIPQGKAVGVMLNRLLEAVIDGSLPNEHDALCAAASQYLHEEKDE